ncbi:MAG: FKBP-type peptidyl-prolyl cis-trans isomerase [Flavobacteriales bacterium]
MKKWFCVGVIAVLLVGCRSSPYDGFKNVGDEIHIKLHKLGDGTNRVLDQDSVKLWIRASRLGEEPGSFVSTERWYAGKDIRTNAMAKILDRMNEGDSLSAITLGSALPWHAIIEQPTDELTDTTHIRLEVAVVQIRTPAMIKAALENLRRSDPDGYELRLLDAYKKMEPREWVRWGTSDVFYVIEGEVKNDLAVVKGDGVTISYKGICIENGKVFDDTDRNGEPLSFRFGDKDQVVLGLEVAIALLREGQEGSFLLPSSYAFGAKGIPGVLEPNMPVKYTVKLDRVVRAPV